MKHTFGLTLVFLNLFLLSTQALGAEVGDRPSCVDLFTSNQYNEAFPACLSDAQEGNEHAQRFVGFMYREGRGVRRDPQEGYKWYLRSAEQGNSDAMLQVAQMNLNGVGTPRNPHLYYQWNLTLATSGDYTKKNTGLYNLGVAYQEGIGVPVNYRKALDYFVEAANEGLITNAMFNIGTLYKNGPTGVRQDPYQAFHWFERAAKRKDAEAMALIGEMYARGEGIYIDFSQAYAWMSLSQLLGHRINQNLYQQVQRNLNSSDRQEAQAFIDTCMQQGYWGCE
ncbi:MULTISPECIES: tetratricopeptide repeat protein [Gammaproteobacteria]|uniref:tetratricopeptide repeat protein n=1 Tax=Gammaproteobacteria TaxID=1236 RepID=UPI000DCFB207|nr:MULTISPECIES: tetratricopeptide repeat protein [Gammaproteobacteria]RTE85503.1 sel1 repeat family protein [Aliidiomarina sp. B3213]TCZ89472.1 sel1 repeat family protein [Lysobacter sp. N42]